MSEVAIELGLFVALAIAVLATLFRMHAYSSAERETREVYEQAMAALPEYFRKVQEIILTNEKR